MSSQEGSGINFGICHEQQTFRLLELPPSLLNLITSNDVTNLTLKSAAPSAQHGSPQAPANAVLCTDNQTFQVRQVQSSNSIFVIQPSENSSEAQHNGIDSVALSAVAKCAVTLELVPTQPSAIAMLRKILPLYKGSKSSPALDSSEETNKAKIIEDLPLSRGEFDEAWKELCAFEREGKSWIPVASSLIDILKSVILAATLRGVKIEDVFAMDELEGVVEEDGHPDTLFRAVIDRISVQNTDSVDRHAMLNREKTISWVGMTFLESQQDLVNGLHIPDMIEGWKNLLPEIWREHATLDILKNKYTHLSKDRIVFDESACEVGGLKEPALAKASVKDSRKWHDKFKNARR